MGGVEGTGPRGVEGTGHLTWLWGGGHWTPCLGGGGGGGGWRALDALLDGGGGHLS